MALVVMALDGVLTEGAPSENVLNYEASTTGRVLFDMLRDSSRVLLLSNDPSKDRTKAWLARERFSRYADVHCYPADSLLSPEEWRVQHTKDLVGIGHHISFYIDSNPAAVERALEAGLGAILVATSTALPGKETGYSPWYSLVDTIERQSMKRATTAVEDSDG